MNRKGKIALIASVFIMSVFLLSLAFAKPIPAAAKACSDKIDNDGDGYTDYPSDPGCSSKTDNSELNLNIQCDDGLDNDGDTQIDYPDDAGCSSPTDNDETNCGDGICEGGEVCDVCVADCGHCNSCSDTDGGIVLYVQGTVSGYSGGSPYSYTDYCINSTSVNEYYCSGSQYYFMWSGCSYNQTCTNGACA